MSAWKYWVAGVVDANCAIADINPQTDQPLDQFEVRDDRLEEFLTEQGVGQACGECVIPVRLKACSTPCSGTSQKCEGGQLHRLPENIIAVTMLGVYISQIDPEALRNVIRDLQRLGFRFYWWTSWASTDDKPKAYILVPFAKEFPYSPAEWLSLRTQLVAAFNLTKWADPACSDPAYPFPLPRKPTEDALHSAGCGRGDPFNWEGILNNDRPLPPVEAKAHDAEPPAKESALSAGRELLALTRVSAKTRGKRIDAALEFIESQVKLTLTQQASGVLEIDDPFPDKGSTRRVVGIPPFLLSAWGKELGFRKKAFIQALQERGRLLAKGTRDTFRPRLPDGTQTRLYAFVIADHDEGRG